jgi:hypothetical protein
MCRVQDQVSVNGSIEMSALGGTVLGACLSGWSQQASIWSLADTSYLLGPLVWPRGQNS